MIAEMISQKLFVLHLGNKKSRKRRQANGVPQGSVLPPMLFNTYGRHPTDQLQKIYYADHIEITTSGSNFKTIENTLLTNLEKLADYFHKWRLKLNPLKIVSSCFHLANRLAKHQLNAPSTISQYLSPLHPNTLK